VRVAVMGAGAVGGYFGAALARAGEDVALIARGAHLEALRMRGLCVRDGRDAFTVRNFTAVADPRSLDPVDVVLFCVKLYDTEAAARALLPLLGESTYVVTLQNGVDSFDTLSRIVGPQRVVGGITYIVASIEEPGVIRRTGNWARIEVAEPNGELTARLVGFESMCRAAGIDIELKRDMRQLVWSKFVLLSATSATTALTRQTIGRIRADPLMRWVAETCIAETLAVGRALGVSLGAEIEQAALERLHHGMSDDAKASQLVDLERGKPLELEHLSGAVHRLGRETGVPTPVHTTVYAALKPYVHGRAIDGRT
jgi:2-dehydropantoate 2-reductase